MWLSKTAYNDMHILHVLAAYESGYRASETQKRVTNRILKQPCLLVSILFKLPSLGVLFFSLLWFFLFLPEKLGNL